MTGRMYFGAHYHIAERRSHTPQPEVHEVAIDAVLLLDARSGPRVDRPALPAMMRQSETRRLTHCHIGSRNSACERRNA
jgi:hypothetical protein